MIRVVLPAQLCSLANVGREVEVQSEGLVTLESVLNTLEDQYPMLRGTIRDQVTKQRRPFIRYFAMGEDLSLDPTSNALPDDVATGKEPLRIIGSMAGG